MNNDSFEVFCAFFEEKYDLEPVFPLSNDEDLGGVIITFKSGDSFFVSADSLDTDLEAAAHELAPEQLSEALSDLKTLQAFCSVLPQSLCSPSTSNLLH